MSNKIMTLGSAAAILLASTAVMQAQEPAASAADNPMVAEGNATHVANLSPENDGAGAGQVLLRLDPQNDTARWTIDLSEFELQSIYIVCGEPAGEFRDPADLYLNQEVGVGMPIEGDATISRELFEQIQAGECSVVAEGAGDPPMILMGALARNELADGAGGGR